MVGYEYCIPKLVDYGCALTGIRDDEKTTLPVRVKVNRWDEPDPWQGGSREAAGDRDGSVSGAGAILCSAEIRRLSQIPDKRLPIKRLRFLAVDHRDRKDGELQRQLQI